MGQILVGSASKSVGQFVLDNFSRCLNVQLDGSEYLILRHDLDCPTLFDALHEQFYITTIQDKESNVSTKVYQFKAFTPKMVGLKLNIVVMIHTHQITKQVSRNIVFTNDLTLDALKVIKYYSLRFQIEFDFRDAKQFYGLSDFKNYKETQVTNAVNIAFTMTVVGKLVLEKYKNKLECPNMGIIDLKTVFRTQKCAEILLNNINSDHHEFLNSPQFLKIARLEAIHI